MRRTLFLLVLAFCAVLSAAAYGQTPAVDTVTLGLGEALGRSLRVSPEVDRRGAQRARAAARLDEAQASRFLTEFTLSTTHSLAPTLDFPSDDTRGDLFYLAPGVENDWSNPRPFNAFEVQIGQPLWTWGELSGSIRAARYGVGVEAAAVERTALDVALRTGEIYYNVLLTQALSRLTGRAGDIVEQAQREVQRLLEEGAADVDDADLFQIRIIEQEYQRRVVEVRQQRQLALSAFNRQLFMPPGTVAVPDTNVLTPLDFTPEPLDVYMTLALENRPELDQATEGIAARAALVEVERSNYYPKLFVGGSFGAQYAAGRYEPESPYINDPFVGSSVRAGFRIEQNLNFFQTEARVDQAKAQLAEVRYQKEGALQLIRFEVEEAYRTLLIAQAALEARDEQLRLSGQWLRTEQINFDLGLGDTENLVRAVRQDLELQIAYYQAVKNYNVAVLELLQAAGLLNEPAKLGTLVDLF